jgi:hypothetical protein
MVAQDAYSLEASVVGKTCVLRIKGTIGQEFNISVAGLALFESVEMNLQNVFFMNSTGLKQFTKWLVEIEKTYPKMTVRLVQVPVNVNRVLLSVQGILAENMIVESVFLPFYCDADDTEDSTVLITRAELPVGSALKPTTRVPKCPKCLGTMQLDGVDSSFFALMQERGIKA